MNNMKEIRGRQVSEDTIVEALKKHCGFEEKPKFDEDEAPVFSYLNDKLIVKMTPYVKSALNDFLVYTKENEYFSFRVNGKGGSWRVGKTWAEASTFYKNGIAKSLFPNEYPNPVL